VRFEGAAAAQLAPRVVEALSDPALRAVFLCPSNPWLSIAPILAVPGMREALQITTARVIAVSPLVGGQAIKGPTAKMMREMGIPTDSASIACFYTGLLDGLVIDSADAGEADSLRTGGLDVRVCQTWMQSDDDKQALARQLLNSYQG
jgi:LPPG:FO 2-phospho-L-lactate transferase